MNEAVAEKPVVLLVDDDADILSLLSMTLSRMGLQSVASESIGQAKKLLAEQQFSLCLTDMRLLDGTGLELVKHTQQKFPQLPIAVITGFSSVEEAVNSLQAGAFDYVTKPVELSVLKRLVKNALRVKTSGSQFGYKLVGHSDTINHLRGQITKLARTQAPIFISGPSGSGKELVARMLHEQGPRSEGLFIAVNCGAIPGELMESEFFGHRRGSFTGATQDKQGLFQAADGGTLFLDEVAELPLFMQVKLLRAIQERCIRPVGAEHEEPVDVRILSASNQPLADLVQAGKFREDLFYRLNVIELNVPGLIDHPEDIPEISRALLERIAARNNITKPDLTSEAMDRLSDYDFPGNVRELENILERALALAEHQTIEANDLAFNERKSKRMTDTVELEGSLDDYLQEQEREIILNALESCRWNKTEAAEQLGMSFRTLRYRLKKLGIEE